MYLILKFLAPSPTTPSHTTPSPIPPPTTSTTDSLRVNLGTAGDFVILTKSGVSTTGTTTVTGNVGTSPIAATAMTRFGLVLDSTKTFSTSFLVVNKMYALDYTVTTRGRLHQCCGENLT